MLRLFFAKKRIEGVKMAKLQGLLTEKNDVKVFILYLMSNVGYPLEYAEVHDIVIQNDYVGYYDFAECFAELLDAKHIVSSIENDTAMYTVSTLGRQVAGELETDIRPIIREKSLRSALRMLSFKRRGAKLRCESSPRDDGMYDFNCAIVDKEGELMNVDLIVDSKQLCEKMELNFRDKPDIVFRGLIALLTGEVNYLVD